MQPGAGGGGVFWLRGTMAFGLGMGEPVGPAQQRAGILLQCLLGPGGSFVGVKAPQWAADLETPGGGGVTGRGDCPGKEKALSLSWFSSQEPIPASLGIRQ